MSAPTQIIVTIQTGSNEVRWVGGVRVSLQVAILKVLASYPDGRALFGAMKSVLAILAGAGPSWSERLKRLAGRCPNLDIFGQALVIRDDGGWQLTDAGREALRKIEEPAPTARAIVVRRNFAVVSSVDRPSQAVRTAMAADRGRRRHRPVAMDRLA
jgi:hypothetical protein